MDTQCYSNSNSEPTLKIDPATLKFAFQPIIDVHTNGIYGYECLMRPGDYAPLDVIKSYAEADQLRLIEEYTFCEGLKAFMDAKLEGYLFLNSFPGISMSVEAALRSAQIGGEAMSHRIVMELLEYTHLDRFAWNLKRRMISTTGANIKYAIDDFGTGTNFDIECLEFYKPDLVKVDRKYIKNIDSSSRNQEVMAQIIHHLRPMEIQILAEGVETEAEFNYLKTLDIDYMQGFYIGKPQIYT